MKKSKLTKIFILATLAPIALSACFKTRSEVERERSEKEMQQTLHKNVYEASETAQQTQAQLGRIQGKLEEAEHFRRKDSEEQKRGMNAVSERINELETRLSNSEKLQAEIIDEMKRMKTENLRMLTEAQPAPVSSGTKKNPEKNNLKQGIEAFQQQRYDEAVSLLEKARAPGPKSKDFIRASYFLGQAEFARKNFAEAISAFSVVFERDGKDATWKKSTLKIAESFQRLGKKKDAKPFAQALVEKFPDSNEAKQAKKFL
jgi:TolA-binding protein